MVKRVILCICCCGIQSEQEKKVIRERVFRSSEKKVSEEIRVKRICVVYVVVVVVA
jgi:hypothetical protein